MEVLQLVTPLKAGEKKINHDVCSTAASSRLSGSLTTVLTTLQCDNVFFFWGGVVFFQFAVFIFIHLHLCCFLLTSFFFFAHPRSSDEWNFCFCGFLNQTLTVSLFFKMKKLLILCVCVFFTLLNLLRMFAIAVFALYLIPSTMAN